MPLLVFAQTTDTANPLVSYGLLGIVLAAFVWMILSGKLVPGREHDRVISEKTDLQRTAPETLSALVSSTAAIKEATQAMRDVLVLLQVLQQRRGP